jgi:hypothetical protein
MHAYEVEGWEAVVRSEDLSKTRSGDEDAKSRIRKSLNGVVLYHHALPVEEDKEIVQIQELFELGIIESIQLKSKEN